MSWISVNDRLPEAGKTVWISNGNGWTTLGCLIEYQEEDEWLWCWGETNGIFYEENGEIVTECECDDLDVRYWHEVPKPLTAKEVEE